MPVTSTPKASSKTQPQNILLSACLYWTVGLQELWVDNSGIYERLDGFWIC